MNEFRELVETLEESIVLDEQRLAFYTRRQERIDVGIERLLAMFPKLRADDSGTVNSDGSRGRTGHISECEMLASFQLNILQIMKLDNAEGARESRVHLDQLHAKLQRLQADRYEGPS